MVGLDPHLHSLRAAKIVARQLGLHVTFVCGDARAMPFPACRFDIAFSYSVLQHFARPDVRTTLREIARVLRSGGTSFIQMPNAFGLRSAYHLARRGFADGQAFDVRYWTPSSLTRMFEELIGPSDLSVDGFFGLGIQASDTDLLPFKYRAVVYASEMMRSLTKYVPFMGLVADSQYVTSIRVDT